MHLDIYFNYRVKYFLASQRFVFTVSLKNGDKVGRSMKRIRVQTNNKLSEFVYVC